MVNNNNSALVEMNMAVTKASFDTKTQAMRIRMVGSDTGEDVFGEKMSLELFNDFTRRIETIEEVPEPYKSVLSEKSGWSGGMPYVSIAHYKSGIEGKNIPADMEKVYVDGEMLKAVAICRSTPLGKAVFKALKDDLENKSDYSDKIRVSIGFLDLSHSHGDYVFDRKGLAKMCPMCENGVGNKIYLKGILVHLALTRKPANPRTDAEVDKSMTDDIVTREDDAESIVGKALAEEIIQNKSVVDDAPDDLITVKSETPEVEVPEVEVEKAAMPKEDEKEEEKEHPSDCTCSACKEKVRKKSVLDESYETLKEKVEEFKSLPRAEALQKIQPMFEALGQAIQAEFVEPEKAATVVAEIDPALSDVLSKMSSMLEAVGTKLGTLSDEVTILKSQIGATKSALPVVESSTPLPRNIQIQRSVDDMVNKAMTSLREKPLSIMEIAQQSVH